MVISSSSYLSDSSSNISSVSGSDSASSRMAELKTYLQWNRVLGGRVERNIEEALHAHSEGAGVEAESRALWLVTIVVNPLGGHPLRFAFQRIDLGQ